MVPFLQLPSTFSTRANLLYPYFGIEVATDSPSHVPLSALTLPKEVSDENAA
jgi:hypothetical protein